MCFFSTPINIHLLKRGPKCYFLFKNRSTVEQNRRATNKLLFNVYKGQEMGKLYVTVMCLYRSTEMPSQRNPSPSWCPICLFPLSHCRVIHYCLSQLKGSVLLLLAVTPQYNRTPCVELQIFLHTTKVPLAGSPDFYLQEDKEPIE